MKYPSRLNDRLVCLTVPLNRVQIMAEGLHLECSTGTKYQKIHEGERMIPLRPWCTEDREQRFSCLSELQEDAIGFGKLGDKTGFRRMAHRDPDLHDIPLSLAGRVDRRYFQ